MQLAAFEINDHQVIRRCMSESLSDLVLEGFVPPFKVSNMVWSRHDSLRIHASDFEEEERARCQKVTQPLGDLPERARSSRTTKKPKPLKQHASPGARYLVK